MKQAALPIPNTEPPLAEMRRARHEILAGIGPTYQTPAIRTFVRAVDDAEDALRKGRGLILSVSITTAIEYYPQALADAPAAEARTRAAIELAVRHCTTPSSPLPSLPTPIHRAVMADRGIDPALSCAPRAADAGAPRTPAPWAYDAIFMNVGGVARQLSIPPPSFPETIASGVAAVELGMVIKGVPLEQHTPAMARVNELLPARLKAELGAGAAGASTDPAIVAELDAELINLYPDALKDTRAIRDTPARRHALSQLGVATLATAAEGLDDVVTTTDGQPSASPTPATSAPTPPKKPTSHTPSDTGARTTGNVIKPTSPTGRTQHTGTALDEVIANAKQIELDVTRSEVEKRYALARLAKRVRDNTTRYGDKGLVRLAKALGRDRSVMYRAAEIASHWSAEEVGELAQRTGKHGLGVSWSHLEIIATQPEKQLRDGLLDRILSEGLSVRELRHVIRPAPTKAVPADAPDAVASAVNQVTVKAFVLTAYLRGKKAWLADVSAAPNAAATQTLNELHAELLKLQAVVAETIPIVNKPT